MRDDIRKPPIDPGVITTALTLANQIYTCHETTTVYEEELIELAQITKQSLSVSGAYASLGPVNPENWVRGLLLINHPLPADLTDAELLKLLEAISKCDGEDWQRDWWLRCVEANTGCTDISNLVYYVETVPGKSDGRIELKPEEILSEAKRWKGRVFVMLPPSDKAD